MANQKKGKVVRVKANVKETPVFTVDEYNPNYLYKNYKAGEEIGIATGNVFYDKKTEAYTLVEVILDNTSVSSWIDQEYLVDMGYVLLDDVDVLGEDVSDNDGTVVIDKNGNEIGTLSQYPTAVKVNKTNREGKDIYILVDSSPISESASQKPKWLTFALWSLVVTGVITFGIIIYKNLK